MYRTTGLHHLTAIASDPQRNLDFYAGTLGLRFVKQTVNFDDPGTYHLYYGDATGRPGQHPDLLSLAERASRPSRRGPGGAKRSWRFRSARWHSGSSGSTEHRVAFADRRVASTATRC